MARGVKGFFQRLNTRLVLAIASVALVGLLISGFAINQILPGYFAEQARGRLDSAMTSTIILLNEIAQNQPANTLTVEEVREALIYQRTANLAVQAIIPATIEIFDEGGALAARATPTNAEDLRRQGLRPDSIASPRRESLLLDMPGNLESLPFTLVIRDPYTNRESTVTEVRSALIGAGFLALLASMVLGVLAARRVTAPIYRLRDVARSVSQGQIDERASPSRVLEVDELAAQFNVMADRLAGTLRMLEADRDRLREFVADVSHELRTPIAALRMYTELQSEEAVDEATRREFLDSSLAQISRLEWLSTNLLDLSRIDAGIYPLDMRDGDIRDPIQAVVQASSETAVHRGVALDSIVPAEPVEMRFDRERIVQLMTNLIGNALKFTPRGGTASVRLEVRDADVTIVVSDTGPGIPADELPRIFERFYRGTNTGDARASGSGLGLAIVRSIVDMHEGEIDLASEVGKGTEFRITLPRRLERRTDALDEKVNETSRVTPPARNPGTVA